MRPVRPMARLLALAMILLLAACSSSAVVRTAAELKRASQGTTPTPGVPASRAGNDVLHPMPPLTPLSLVIASVGIDARVEPVGVQAGGELATPPRDPWDDVGWYNLGPLPGKPGSAVVDGHLDRPGGYPAVFWRLRDVQVGDEVQVTNAAGQMLRFRVRRIAYYTPDQAPIQDIFGNLGGTYLNLITCAGDWIPSQHQTTLRLVVYTAFI